MNLGIAALIGFHVHEHLDPRAANDAANASRRRSAGMGRMLHSPERDRAWGRYYKQRGMNCITSGYFTSNSNAVRIALYQLRLADMANGSRYSGASN